MMTCVRVVVVRFICLHCAAELSDKESLSMLLSALVVLGMMLCIHSFTLYSSAFLNHLLSKCVFSNLTCLAELYKVKTPISIVAKIYIFW